MPDGDVKRSRGYLFCGGMPRSGTTALQRVLGAHPEILLGNERFFHLYKNKSLAPRHFEEGRYFNIEDDDTHPAVRRQFDNDRGRMKYKTARWIGDKYPPIYQLYDFLKGKFQGVLFLYILRNPLSLAESFQARFDKPGDKWGHDYRAAIVNWNESVSRTLAALLRRDPIIVVSYEKLFSSAAGWEVLFSALDVATSSMPSRVIAEELERFEELKRTPALRNDEIRQFVFQGADFATYRRLLDEFDILNQSLSVSAERVSA